MGMIFRMILSIFGEIFDQDARRRQEEQARAAALRQRMAQRELEAEGGAKAPPKPKGFLQQVMAELEQLESSPEGAGQAPASAQRPALRIGLHRRTRRNHEGTREPTCHALDRRVFGPRISS